MSESSRNTTGEFVEMEQDCAVITLLQRSQPEIDAVLAQVDETSRQRIAHGIASVRQYGDGLARSMGGLSDEMTVMVPRGMIGDESSVGGGANTTSTLDFEDLHGDMGYYGGAGSHEDLAEQ